MTEPETRRDPLRWYSPCGYFIDGLFNAASPIPTCPTCFSMAWATFPPPTFASPTPDTLDVEVLAEAMRRVDREDGRYPMPVDGYYEGLARDTLREYAAILARGHQ